MSDDTGWPQLAKQAVQSTGQQVAAVLCMLVAYLTDAKSIENV